MNSNNKFLSQLLVSFLEFAEKGNGIKEASVLGQFEKACYEKITDQIRSSIGKEMTLASLVKIEEYILEHKRDAAIKKGDKEALSHILGGLTRINDAYGALRNLKDEESFKRATDAIPEKFFKKGLPEDSFIYFCKGQRTSIHNENTSSNLPMYIKEFNNSRIECIDWAKKLYQQIQYNMMCKIATKEPSFRASEIFLRYHPEALQQKQQKQAPATQQQSNKETSDPQKQNTQKSDLDR